MAQMDQPRIKICTHILPISHILLSLPTVYNSCNRKMEFSNEPEKKKMRAYDQSHIEIVLRVLQFFEQERIQHRRINLNNFPERSTAATRVNRSIISKIHIIEDVLKWKNKPDLPVATRKEPLIPKKFSIIVRQVVREIYLEHKQLPTLDLILEGLKQKKVNEFDNFNLCNGDEIPDTNSNICIWGHTSLYRFMKSVGFTYGDKISH